MKIALSQRIFYHKGRAYDAIEHGWYSYLDGHTLTFIPNFTDQDFEALAENVDALIITGGDDSALRRTVEIKVATEMMKHQKPIVGICHGCFLLQDILGGNIVDVSGHVDTDHSVDYFGQQYQVNSYHSLGIDKPHASAKILATDSEGHCEAWMDGNLAGIVRSEEHTSELQSH